MTGFIVFLMVTVDSNSSKAILASVIIIADFTTEEGLNLALNGFKVSFVIYLGSWRAF
jgi:hypothetical protein